MKKFFALALSVLLAAPAMAQTEEDVTSLIQNAGFDEDLTFQADGTMKEAVSTNTSLSGRSWAYIAADSTVYARPKSTSSQSRPDGRKMEAVNGFKGRIQGWQLESNGTFPACEWTYFGSVAYDLGPTAVPIADDGSTYLVVPARPTDFDGGEGFVYLRAGWGGSAAYKQVVKLPCAVYRLEYWTININPNTTSTVTDLTKIVCRKSVFKDETGSGMQAQVWTKHEFEFTPTAEFTMQFGYQAANAGSGGMPIVALDGIKLYKIGEADPAELLESDLADLQGELDELAGQAQEDYGMEGVAGEINDYAMEIDDIIGGSIEEMQAKYNEATAKVEYYKQVIACYSAIKDALDKIELAISKGEQGEKFPGYEDLVSAYAALNSQLQNGDSETILGLADACNNALFAYYYSQDASEQSPANYTFLVKSPWFCKPAAEPTYDEGRWVFPNAANYTVGSAPEDATSEGWYQAGRSGGDQRLNYAQGRICWNAWCSGFTDVIAVAQDLTDIPNGYYTVSADMITQAGYITDQHVYATSTAQKVISATLNSDAYNAEDPAAGVWDDGMTTDKVLVVDGKLTIGAEGTGNGNAAAGWFLVTNFRLNYLGEADPSAIQQLYQAQLDEANTLAATMHFAADKKALLDTLAVYGSKTTTSEMILAMNSIKEALAVAKASEAKYEEYMEEGKTLPTVKATLEGEGYKAATEIVKFAYDYVEGWLACDTATYTQMDAQVNLLKNYLNTYAPVYNRADSVANIASESAKQMLQNVMASQKAILLNEMQTATVVNDMVAELNRAIALVDKENTFNDENARDYTVFIQNPNLEAEDGWVFERGNGDKNTTQSQWYDGSNTRYIDSYNSNGLTGFKATQTITDLPNGTYNVSVFTRTPAEGAYILYALEGQDTVYVEIPLDYYEDPNTGEQAIASDTHGPIWDEANLMIMGDDQTAPLEQEDPMYAYYYAIWNANGGKGRGWKHQMMENIVVTDHILTIGTLAGNTETRGTEKTFGGAWYSVGGWKLQLLEKGDNTDWSPIAVSIENAKDNIAVIEGIYNLNGLKMQKMQRGLNIVVRNGKAQKIIVK